MSWLMPRIYDWALARTEERGLQAWRSELLATLSGSVLEVGAGTGANLPHYPAKLERLVLCEPDPGMRRQLERKLRLTERRAGLATDALEQLSFPSEQFDYLVSTLVLCSVDSLERSLREAWRVLRPGGALVFLEHVAGPHYSGQLAWQHRLEPLWRWCAGNCHLTRRTAEALVKAGFELEGTTAASMPAAPFFVRPTVRGRALRPA